MVPPVASLNARDRRTIRKTLGLCARNFTPGWICGRGREEPQSIFSGYQPHEGPSCEVRRL